MMKKWNHISIGPFLIMRAADYPAFEKANKISRCLTENDIDDLLQGKAHIHRNPTKRKPPVPYPGEEGVYPKSGE
jgi:hypothetical protein